MKTISLNFHDDTISLKSTDENTIVCQDLDNIFMAIRSLHKVHLKEIETLDFESGTEKALLVLIKGYINSRADLIEDYYNTDSGLFNNWKCLLTSITDHITYIIDISKEKLENYSYNIKTIESNINMEKHTITIIIKNIENNRFLQATILLKEHIILSKNVQPKNRFSIEPIVATEMGRIRFEPID